MSWYLYHNMTLELKEKLYTSSQVANILGVSLRTLYRYMESGKIKSLRTASGRHRFTKQQILQFLNAGPSQGGTQEESDKKGVGTQSATKTEEKADEHFDFGPIESNVSSLESGTQPRADNLENEQSAESDNDPFIQEGNAGQDVSEKITERTFESKVTLNNDTVIKEQETVTEVFTVNSEQVDENRHSNEENFEVDEDFIGSFMADKQSEGLSETEDDTKEVASINTAFSDDYKAEDFSKIVEPARKNYTKIKYFQSSVTSDTIELAKKINDLAKFKAIDYAFSCYAGLSLYFLLDKEFYTIHFYINEEEQADWVEGLDLKECQETEANIAIMLNNDIVFPAYKVVYDYRVIDDAVLVRDLKDLNQVELVDQFKDYLKEK